MAVSREIRYDDHASHGSYVSQGATSVKRIYSYEDHNGMVAPEPAWKPSRDFTPVSRRGCDSVVQTVRIGSIVSATARLRLAAERH